MTQCERVDSQGISHVLEWLGDHCWEDEIATAVLSGLASLPPGPERTRAIGARCAIIISGISQIQSNLDETEYAIEEANMKSMERDFYTNRITWALDMSIGLTKAVTKLKAFELADLKSVGNRSLDAEYNRVVNAQYSGMLTQLNDCTSRVAKIAKSCAVMEKSMKKDIEVCNPQQSMAKIDMSTVKARDDVHEDFEQFIVTTLTDRNKFNWPMAWLSDLLNPTGEFYILVESLLRQFNVQRRHQKLAMTSLSQAGVTMPLGSGGLNC